MNELVVNRSTPIHGPRHTKPIAIALISKTGPIPLPHSSPHKGFDAWTNGTIGACNAIMKRVLQAK